MRSLFSNVPFTHEERIVWEQIGCCRGHQHALSIDEIARRTGIVPREIKAAVNGLRLRHRLPIGSSRRKPYGYFVIDSAAEMEATCRPLTNQAMNELRVVRAIRGADKVWLRELLGQLDLEEEKAS